MKASSGYYIIRLILFVLVVLLAASCVTQRRCMEKFPPVTSRDSAHFEKRDSAHTENSRDINIVTPGDSINVNAPVVNCPDQEVAAIEIANLKQEIQILNGRLISKTTIQPKTNKVQVTDTRTDVRVTNNDEFKVTEVKTPDPVKYIPRFYKYCFRILLLEVIAGLIYLVVKLKIWKLIRHV